MLPKIRIAVLWLATSLLVYPNEAFSLIIPFRVEQPKREFGGLMYVSVRMGNKVSLLRLATGAATSRVQKEDWNKDFRILDHSLAMSASGEGDACDIVEVPEFSLLSRTEDKVEKTNYLVSRCEDEINEDMLGINFFYGQQVFIDFDNESIEVNPEVVHRRRAWRRFKVVQPTTRPLFAIPIDIGRPMRMPIYGLMDTGAEVTVVDARVVDAYPELFTFVRDMDGASDYSMTKVFRLKRLKVSDKLELHDVEVLVYDLQSIRMALGVDIPIILGFNVLSRFNWHLDLRDPGHPTWLAEKRTKPVITPE